MVAEFTRLTARLALLAAGKATQLAGAALSAGRTRRPLEMFFPFDPYLLRRSARFLDLEVGFGVSISISIYTLSPFLQACCLTVGSC